MSDSVERVLEDAGMFATEYWDCKKHDLCADCPARELDAGSCIVAQQIDLVNRTRALYEHQLPEGVEWPRYEDGELVQIGDEVEFHDGEIEKVLQVFIGQDGYTLYGETKEEFSEYGTPVDRPEPEDAQEKIYDDATLPPWVYASRIMGADVRGNDEGEMQVLMIRDLLRRQRELCERSAK